MLRQFSKGLNGYTVVCLNLQSENVYLLTRGFPVLLGKSRISFRMYMCGLDVVLCSYNFELEREDGLFD